MTPSFIFSENRLTPIYDFGYVAMNFGWVYPEDSGEYVCRASNLYGSDETRGIIKTTGKPGIIYDSQLPRGMESIDKIRKLESGWQRVEQIEVENERFKPCFVTKPEPQEACVGDTARFCCRVTGYPKPRVMWLLNGHTVINVSIENILTYLKNKCFTKTLFSLLMAVSLYSILLPSYTGK